MCWNEHVSLNTFIFSIGVILLVAYNNAYTPYKIHEMEGLWPVLFILSVSSMQLVEWFIWRNMKNQEMNYYGTILTAILLLFQPIASIMMISKNKIRDPLLLAYIITGISYSVYFVYTYPLKTTVSSHGHLQWNLGARNLLPALAWVFFAMFAMIYEKKWVMTISSIVTLAIAFWTYSKYKTVGSMWCWSTNSLMVGYAAYLLFGLPFKELNGLC